MRFQETERYKLGKPSTFRYLNQSNCYALDGLDDSKEYLATRKAMDVVGIGSEDQVLSFWLLIYTCLDIGITLLKFYFFRMQSSE